MVVENKEKQGRLQIFYVKQRMLRFDSLIANDDNNQKVMWFPPE